jgi:hypothetical protein
LFSASLGLLSELQKPLWETRRYAFQGEDYSFELLDWLFDGESPVTGRITPALPVTLA